MNTRKPRSSKLDPFTNELLQMDQDKVTVQKMLAWLAAKKVSCSKNALRHFLTTRRAASNRNHLLEWLATSTANCRAVERHFAKNPAPEIETLMKVFCAASTQLSENGASDPELLKVANQLTRTALDFNLSCTKSKFTERTLIMAEAKHAEWVKCEQSRALELCLKEAKNHPVAARAFRHAFRTLRDIESPALRDVETPPSPAWSATNDPKLPTDSAPTTLAK